jgi:hypothetical protein
MKPGTMTTQAPDNDRNNRDASLEAPGNREAQGEAQGCGDVENEDGSLQGDSEGEDFGDVEDEDGDLPD